MTLFENKPSVPEGILIEGSFTCMTCDEVVEEANYLPVDKMLGWKCSNGHKSAIENFSLGV
jgi:formylmethanofuran dehydrogenase subunit E